MRIPTLKNRYIKVITEAIVPPIKRNVNTPRKNSFEKQIILIPIRRVIIKDSKNQVKDILTNFKLLSK